MNAFIFLFFEHVGWCGMQKDFCLFLLDLIPLLREYGNVSYRQSDQRSFEPSDIPEVTNLSPSRYSPKFFKPKAKNITGDSRTVVPVLVIDLPD